jgi:beta-1,2-mannobiose phosphorylase / 1,2-beta-oligomannan phosphorylase
MEPEPGNPNEIEGVLNPAAVRGPDGELYLFPRLVAKGNYSRIGIARVVFNEAGDPKGVERLGLALEPEADYELRPGGGGGCEDARITFVEPLQSYVMTYTAFSAQGPRIALALSKDLFHWKRLGLATFGVYRGTEIGDVDDKDASLFPVAIPNPSGQPELAMLHRPLFPGTRPEETACCTGSRNVDLDRESIWISYCSMSLEAQRVRRAPQNEPGTVSLRTPFCASSSVVDDLCHIGAFSCHHRLAAPVSPWERLKIGGGTPPVLTKHGWLIVYHGVSEMEASGNGEHPLCYSAGVMVLSKDHPRVILYRSAHPVLTPSLPQERDGTVANVVFPTGIDRRDDVGLPDRFDVYYGMADSRIGVARLDVPECLPPERLADPPEAKV